MLIKKIIYSDFIFYFLSLMFLYIKKAKGGFYLRLFVLFFALFVSLVFSVIASEAYPSFSSLRILAMHNPNISSLYHFCTSSVEQSN
jgi:hypothetical protein